MDDLILQADEPVEDMGDNGAFAFFDPPEEEESPPTVSAEDAPAATPYGKVPDDAIKGDRPTVEDLQSATVIMPPAPTSNLLLIGLAVAAAAYILLGD